MERNTADDTQAEEAVAESLLSYDEAANLLINFANTRSIQGFTEDEAQQLIEWARGVRLNNTLLDLALDGQVNIDWKDGGYVVTAREGHARTDSSGGTLPASDLPRDSGVEG